MSKGRELVFGVECKLIVFFYLNGGFLPAGLAFSEVQRYSLLIDRVGESSDRLGFDLNLGLLFFHEFAETASFVSGL